LKSSSLENCSRESTAHYTCVLIRCRSMSLLFSECVQAWATLGWQLMAAVVPDRMGDLPVVDTTTGRRATLPVCSQLWETYQPVRTLFACVTSRLQDSEASRLRTRYNILAPSESPRGRCTARFRYPIGERLQRRIPSVQPSMHTAGLTVTNSQLRIREFRLRLSRKRTTDTCGESS